MAFGIESGSVIDRSFNAGGLSRAIADWIVKAPVDHGPGWYMWDDQSGIGTDPYIVVCDQSSPTANSKAIFLRILMSSSIERVEIRTYLWWDNVVHSGKVGFQAVYVSTVTGSFAYYFRGGTNTISIITRIGSNTYQMRLDKFEGIWNASTGKGLEPEAASGVLDAPADLVNGITDVTLQAGQGANFTIGRWYFLIDLAQSTTRIAYVKVTDVVGDVLSLQYVTSKSFGAGAYISPYPHRWVSNGITLPGQSNSSVKVPYGNVQGSETIDGATSASTIAQIRYMGAMSDVNPDDEGDYAAMFPWVQRGNKILGKLMDVIVTSPGGLSVLQDRRIVNGIPYLAIDVQSSHAFAILDQESV